MAMKSSKPHVALLASPGMGHLIPDLELGKRLVVQHELQVTIFVVATDTATVDSQLCCSLPNPNLFNVVSLPPVDISGIVDPDAAVVTKIIVMMRESFPALRSAISAMKLRPTALFVDLFGSEAMAIADEFSMLKYVFIASNAWFLSATAYFPTIDKQLEEEHINQKKPLMIPGCKPVRFEDTLEAFLDPKDQVYAEYLRLGREIPTADGILINSWEDLETTTLAAMRDTTSLGRVTKVPVYPIGPLVRPVRPAAAMEDSVLGWLDKQPTESVMYVSFGSGGTLSAVQMIELAWGLERSQQRFVWVVRPPMEDNVSGAFFNVQNGSDGTPNYLPDGFLTRNSEKGLVVPTWAPQSEILAHPSMGGFLSHCGWNSTVESIVNGVPMIAWPLYAEQKMNATMLTEELGVAIRSKESPPPPTTERVVEREEIETMVRRIMVEKEGHGIRSRVDELKNSAQKALSTVGSSYNSLSKVAVDCRKNFQDQLSMAQGA